MSMENWYYNCHECKEWVPELRKCKILDNYNNAQWVKAINLSNKCPAVAEGKGRGT